MNKLRPSMPLLIIMSLGFLLSAEAQILNPSFEIAMDSIPTNPKHWNFNNNEQIQFSLTTSTKASGAASLYANASNSSSSGSNYFSQVTPFQGNNLQRVIISFYMKSDLDGTAGVWWQVRDKENNQIGFTNSGMQSQSVVGKQEWTKYALLQTINEKCSQFVFGGYVNGKGQVWFDDFQIEDVQLADTKPSKSVTQYLMVFKKLVKKHSLYADSLDWKKIDNDLKYLSRGVNNIDDMAAPRNYILDMLRAAGDNHSFIASKTSFEASQASQMSTSVPYSKLLVGNIGYINVPDFSSRNDSVLVAFATTIQDLIKALDEENNIKSWVVDLRDNGGGNMHPMLAGLGPLIGEGKSGNFVVSRANKSVAWFYKSGGFRVGKAVTTQVKQPYYLKQAQPKIAVLIGDGTGSSGEMTAVAFIGLKNTKLFGQTSAGYTTTNDDFGLPNGARLYLASGYVSDRNNKMYLKNIQPDVLVVEDTKGKDKTLEAAVGWLKQ